MPKFNVVRPVKIRGKLYKSGTVDCAEKDAAPLLKSGALSTGDGQNADGDLHAFVKAIGQLNAGNKEHWTKDGRPDLKALEAVGLTVTAKVRDALWEEAKKQQLGAEQ